ncbi:Hypothetical predicted protein, partial [Scomber scombrus]
PSSSTDCQWRGITCWFVSVWSEVRLRGSFHLELCRRERIRTLGPCSLASLLLSATVWTQRGSIRTLW